MWVSYVRMVYIIHNLLNVVGLKFLSVIYHNLILYVIDARLIMLWLYISFALDLVIKIEMIDF